MKDIAYIFSSIRSHFTLNILTISMVTIALTIIIISLMVFQNIEQKLNASKSQVDLVIGAKGSPLQLVLSSLYHTDIPTGNIPLSELAKYQKNKQIKSAIPLALGDNYKGFRIVGTSLDWFDLYETKISKGQMWNDHFEVVIGANVAKLTALNLGDAFSGAHGLVSGSGQNKDHVHENTKYKVVGILEAANNVADNLILTPYQSVIDIHSSHAGHEHEGHEDENSEITALLIQVKSPLAVLSLPRQINRESHLMVANPALEMSRLSQIFGVGTDSLLFLSIALCFLSIMSLMTGLMMSMEQKRYDYTILRVLGYQNHRLWKILISETLLIVGIGVVFSFIFTKFIFVLLQQSLPDLLQDIAFYQFSWSIALWVSCAAIGISILISVITGFKLMNSFLYSELRK